MTRRLESGTVSLVIGYIYQVLTQYTDLVKPAFDEVKKYDTQIEGPHRLEPLVNCSFASLPRNGRTLSSLG